ncbi:MAG: ABC transporter ATP-binding protein/permease [Mogibacterium sp.]|nr:ABC transporter ATP-binding protein/permease [Mogibacterium sp.]
MIRLQNVNKYFNHHKSNEIHVINNTSLELPETGIVTILGPSGCGKTTLLNAIGGLDKVNSGKIYIDDDRITGVLSGRKDTIRNAKIGYIFQNYNLLDNRTVFENVAVALRMVGVRDRKVIRERVNYCLEAVGIYQYRNKTADALSGGQRQRVAIARAIVKNPRIIIADEPTGNLDSVNTLEVMNIIKTISRDRLVLLVTHERKLAEFYSERIIEMKDGVIISDVVNDSSRFLDYQLENKIYLRDLPVSKSFTDGNFNVEVYSDEERQAGIKMVIRGGNLYIDTGGRFNVVDETANIEMVDEHYSMIDETIYADHNFQYDKYLPENFKARYRSLYNPLNMLLNGFRSVGQFRMIKKLLLLGFVFAAMFMFFAVSNVLGILDIKEKDFLTTNDHYVTVSNPSKSEQTINEVAALDESTYAIPGSSLIQMTVPLNDYYQTANAAMTLNGSLTFAEVLDSDQVILGRMPEDEYEIAVDRMILDKFLSVDGGKSCGITTVEQFLERPARVNNLNDFTIVGITDTNSPSIYVDGGMYKHILLNAKEGSPTYEYTQYSAQNSMWDDYGDNYDEENEDMMILDYKFAPNALKIEYGRAPKDEYEVIMNINRSEEYELNKEIDVRVGGIKLNLVGFYRSDNMEDILYVSTDTLWQKYVSGQKTFSVYAEDPAALRTVLKEKNLTCKINYNTDRSNYLKEMQSTFRSALIVAAIILLIALIEMFLMLRSSFLSRIKEVGTLRAIGLRKFDIYSMFTGEILAITLITAIPGIALMYYIMYHLVQITEFLEGMYLVTPYAALLSFVIILAFNLIAGLLPVFRTMRKTPAAILARTDI